jgi:hypothetical protein
MKAKSDFDWFLNQSRQSTSTSRSPALEIHNNVLDADVGPGDESHEAHQEQADVLQNSRTENEKQR